MISSVGIPLHVDLEGIAVTDRVTTANSRKTPKFIDGHKVPPAENPINCSPTGTVNV